MSEYEFNPAVVPFWTLVGGIVLKVAWKLGLKKRPEPLVDSSERFVWQADSVSDADGPEGNVRNYLERRTLRHFLNNISKNRDIVRAAEVGCGYARLAMVLTEYADHAIGYEREEHLVEMARTLNPEMEFRVMPSLKELRAIAPENYDFVYTCTILQHVVDEECRAALDQMKKMASCGFVLLIEKTEAISVTENQDDGSHFLSRARSVDTYSELMQPFELIEIAPRVMEPTYFNEKPGTCMLFKAPGVEYDSVR